jgi:hypothetical protein
VNPEGFRQFRKSVRRALTVRRWSLHREIALGIWIPVAVAALVLFTGPNRPVAAPAHPAPAATTSTTVARIDDAARLKALSDPAATPDLSTEIADSAASWIGGVPHRKTLPQGLGVQKFKAQQKKRILATHRQAVRQQKAPLSAVKSTRH